MPKFDREHSPKARKTKLTAAAESSRGSDRPPQIICVHVPLMMRKRGARKVILAPTGEPPTPRATQTDKTLVRALARAHRWKRMLEGGEFASISELAAAEQINQSYLCRMLRLNLLSPDIVTWLLDGIGRVPAIQELSRPLPAEWDRQRALLGF